MVNRTNQRDKVVSSAPTQPVGAAFALNYGPRPFCLQ